MNQKKILFLVPCPPPFAGPEIANQKLLNSSAFKKTNITFINANIRKENKNKGKFDLSGLTVFLGKYLQVLYHLLFGRVSHFYFLLSSSKVGFLRDSVYILTAKLLGKKTIGHYRGSNFDGFFVAQSNTFQKYIRFVLKRINSIFIQAECIRPMFDGIYPGDRVQVIYNGIDSKNYIIQKAETNTFTIFFMGHLWYPKGYYDLIQAYKQLHLKYGDQVKLLLAGELPGDVKTDIAFLKEPWKTDYLNNRQRILKEMDDFTKNAIDYNAEYLGLIDFEGKLNVFNRTDVFVLPSYSEGFSFACLEAMTMGVSVITTPVGAMPEVIKSEVNGIITPLNDQQTLFENLDRLKSNVELRKTIENNNIEHSRNNFEIEEIAKKLIDIILKSN